MGGEDGVGGLLAKASRAFEMKEFAKALDALSDAEDILARAGRSAAGADLVAGIENLKGFNYLGLNDLDAAKTSFEKALQADPFSSQACAGLGETFFVAAMDKEAKTMYELAVMNDPDNPMGVTGLTKVNRQLGFPESHTTLAGQMGMPAGDQG